MTRAAQEHPFGIDEPSIVRADRRFPSLRHCCFERRSKVIQLLYETIPQPLLMPLLRGTSLVARFSRPEEAFETFLSDPRGAALRDAALAVRGDVYALIGGAVREEAAELADRPSTEQVLRWDVQGALHAAALDGVRDVRPMADIAQALRPDSASRYLGALETAQRRIETRREHATWRERAADWCRNFSGLPNPAAMKRFSQTVRALNDEWLHPEGLHLVDLVRVPRLYEVDDPAGVELTWAARLGDSHLLTTSEGCIRFVTLRDEHPTNQHGIHYNPVGNEVVFSLRSLTREVGLIDEAVRRGDDVREEDAFLRAEGNQSRNIGNLLRGMPRAQMAALIAERAIAEELRHALDSMRGQFRIPESASEERRAEELLAAHLRPGGFFERNVPRRGSAFSRIFYRSIVSEFSGMLTAAATHPYPQIVLYEWLRLLESFSVRREEMVTGHSFAALYGTHLLGSAFGKSLPRPALPRFDRESAIDDEEFPAAIPVLEHIIRQSAPALRLAMKAVWSAEFRTGAIDEAPFSTIAADGSLLWGSQRFRMRFSEEAFPGRVGA